MSSVLSALGSGGLAAAKQLLFMRIDSDYTINPEERQQLYQTWVTKFDSCGEL